jgi:L-alanine-DL-glutamate epimerase-like enolase superfamily enzyme
LRSRQAYATGCYYGENFRDRTAMLADLREEAASYKASGFGLLKMKVGLLSVEADAQRVATVRAAVGLDIGLLADANHAYKMNAVAKSAAARAWIGFPAARPQPAAPTPRPSRVRLRKIWLMRRKL